MDEVIFNIVTEEQPNEVIRIGLPRLDSIFEKIAEIKEISQRLEQKIAKVNDTISDRDLSIVKDSLSDAYDSLVDVSSELKGCYLFLE